MTQPRGAIIVIVACLLVVPHVARTFPSRAERRELPEIPRILIAWTSPIHGPDSLDQQAFLTMLRVAGLRPVKAVAGSFDLLPLRGVTLLVVPNCSSRRLTQRNVSFILQAVRQGMRLVTDGAGQLAESLGVVLDPPVKIVHVRDHMRPDLDIHWPDSPAVPRIASFPASCSVLFSAGNTSQPLVLSGSLGSGKWLFLSTLFDPLSGEGYARFPTLPMVLMRNLGVKPIVRRAAADAYFDPGYRYGQPLERLVRQWKKNGIRAVHVAAWYFYDDTPYPYATLLDALHREGILCYAWLEWPYVGKGFWDRHPEWREKNALLKDARIDFLYLMDMQNPACLHAAMDGLRTLLREEWDGVDIAEFSMTGGVGEALAGPSQPGYFTGFSDVGRRVCLSEHGFDPLDLFQPSSPHFWKTDSVSLQTFYRHRIEVDNILLRRIMGSLDSLRHAERRPWELLVTVLDNLSDPEVERLLATDLRAIKTIAAKTGFTMQIEDLGSKWNTPPDRYEVMGEKYGKFLKGRRFLIDINAVPVHPASQVGFATTQPVGVELARLWEAASSHAERICFYAENSIDDADWELLPYTFASGIEVETKGRGYLVSAPASGHFIHAPDIESWKLDGMPWPALGPGYVVLPRGSHRLEPLDSALQSSGPRLLDISGDLLTCSARGDTLIVQYESSARCALTLSAQPRAISVDGTAAVLPLLRGEKRFVILAPPGRHRIRITNFP